MSSPGAKPFYPSGSSEPQPQIENSMVDKRYQPTLQENFMLGVEKAHRSIVFSHYEYRNYDRSHLGDTRRL